jgi:hypothetical protein
MRLSIMTRLASKPRRDRRDATSGTRLQGVFLLLVAPLSRLAPWGTRTSQRGVPRATWDAHDNRRFGTAPSRVQVLATFTMSFTATSHSQQPQGVMAALRATSPLAGLRDEPALARASDGAVGLATHPWQPEPIP